ncbi:UbiA family prenyltransferase [Pseudohoeflea coraliihabitans]|uniref:UbiA family prenyltransferase n=1 Tax=Pseudohoeflea coraliihabitans TaxID=2860393 RepID=A0ABS6WQN5_9HYPH|nr:UbiA family prenyltransferase [Pseudohoeflea sp. DP4N28-3]MBW3098230.1 UbiA family prenyltransferase [Pseudohoeflea sp. DP4N28-3]
MDTRAETRQIPLCIDLDGTLIAADSLWESLAVLLLHKPWLIFPAFLWGLRGKHVLKREVARRCGRQAADWPYRDEVLALIDAARDESREVWLVTGAAQQVATDIASHLGLFDRVLHSCDKTNLTSGNKRQALIKLCGEGGFDYVGNSRDDIKVFDAARRALIVAPDRAARSWGLTNGGTFIETTRVSRLAPLKAIRVHQWLKNVLIGVPLVLNHEYASLPLLIAVACAFFSFSFFASAVYVLNDIIDLGNDRRHARKKFRPIACGAVSIPSALTIAAALLVGSLALASLLPPAYWAVLALYGLVTTAYTFVLKRKLLVDVFTLAGLYTVRILAGIAATATAASFWLLAFSIFFFLSLALVKRFVELDETEIDACKKLNGRSYLGSDKDMVAQGGIASAFSAAMVLALYVNSDQVVEMYGAPWVLWPLCPLILYMLMRIWVLASRSQMHDDPVIFILRDWRSQVVTLSGAILVLVAAVL